MKKIINILLALTILIVASFSLVGCDDGAGSGTEKGLLLKKYSGEDFYTVYKYVDEGKNITKLDIAEIAGEKTVGRIAKNAFNGNDTLVEIIVPNTVEEIEANAFAKMKKLEKITLPFVGKTAVADSYPSQTDDSENKSVETERNFAYIFGTEEYAYGEKISINHGSAKVDYYIPTNLKEITIAPKGEYNIPMYAFSGVGLINKINLTGSITEIGENAFENCRDLSAINIPATVKTIYKNAFKGCSFLVDGLTFDDNSTLEVIKDSAFRETKIKTLVLPDSVKVIGEYAFAESSLVSVKLSANLEKIGAYAFYDSKNLASVIDTDVLNEYVVGVWAFEGCKLG